MARLLTNHDKYHIHAILGLMVLMHYSLRWYLIFMHGDAFSNQNNMLFNVLAVLLHSALPLSALPLPIPRARNLVAPMIWEEFRLHSVVFASRHTSSTVAALLAPSCYWIQLVIVHLTLFGASWASEKHGNQEQRTTNAMPYATQMEAEKMQHAKNMYARAQFMATAFTLVGQPTLSFIPTLGIQSAPFLMTLVRKGKISTSTYHQVYAWTLLLPLPATMFMLHTNPILLKEVLSAFAIGALAKIFRTKISLGKHISWLLAPLAVYVIALHTNVVWEYLQPLHKVIPFYHIAMVAGLARNFYLIPQIILKA